jgi:hypothetical protein
MLARRRELKAVTAEKPRGYQNLDLLRVVQLAICL